MERPEFDRHGPGASSEAAAAVATLVAGLQKGWDLGDADLTDQRLAADVIWGSPFGATLQGFDELHDIHVKLKHQGMGGPSSRFEIVRVLAPTADVVLAQVRRQALDGDGGVVAPDGAGVGLGAAGGPFSEMILYVLVKRDGRWWLIAGHNTPIRTKPEPSAA